MRHRLPTSNSYRAAVSDANDGKAPVDTAAYALEVRARAMRLLVRREHAPKELALKLAKRGYCSSVVQTVLGDLIAENLLSSQRYAESLVRVRIEKGRGPVYIRDELSGHDIAESEIEQALAEADADWARLAARARRKRFGKALPIDFPSKAKQMRFLRRRGFANDQIQAAFSDN